MIKESIKTSKVFVSGYVEGQVYNVELKPSSMSFSVKNISELIEAVDGSVNYMHRNFKGSWSVNWQMIPKSTTSPILLNTVDQIKTLYYSMGYINTALWLCFQSAETSEITSVMVIPEPNSYSEDLAASQVSLTNKPFYNVSIRFIQT